MKSVKPQEIFNFAMSYHSASVDLRRKESKRTVQHAYPSIQLSFMAVELLLKCMQLHYLGMMQSGHELHKLFHKLPEQMRQDLQVLWAQEFTSGPYMKLPKEMLAHLPHDVSLYTVLRSANHMHGFSRYPWEKNGNRNLFIVQELPDLIYRYLVQRNPTWRLAQPK